MVDLDGDFFEVDAHSVDLDADFCEVDAHPIDLDGDLFALRHL